MKRPTSVLIRRIRAARRAARSAAERGLTARAEYWDRLTSRSMATLWARLAPLVTGLAFRLRTYARGANLDEDDLVNEGFCKLAGAVERYDDSRQVPFEGWFHFVLFRHLLDITRRRRREVPAAGLDAAEYCADASAEHELAAIDVRDLLDSLLLDDAGRAAKVAAFQKYHLDDGYSLRELAEQCKVCASTVRRWIREVEAACLSALHRSPLAPDGPPSERSAA